MQKGAPSVNPTGVAKASATKPSGSDGVAIFNGLIQNNERDPKLIGREKWITYSNLEINTAIVASAMRMWCDLGGSSKLRAEPNKRGGKDAQKGADIVTEGLLEAQMSKPIGAIVRRQLLKKFRGFALHEALIRRRSDGMIVFGDLQHRPQWTVYRWIKDDEQSPWTAIEQLTLTGQRFTVPRDRLFYSVDDNLTDSPAGIGLLRHLAEAARIRDVYTRLEGVGFQTDLGGMPVGRAPMAQLRNMAVAAGCKDEPAIQTFIATQVKPLTDLLAAHNKRADQWLMLDSMPYLAKGEQQTPSSVLQWSFDVVRTAMTAAPAIAAAIARMDREMARLMNAEFLLLGGEDSGGAYSMHADKTSMFGLSVSAALDDVCDDMTRDLAARLVALNGLDPETCTPRIVAEPIATSSVVDVCRALQLLAQSGLHPMDKATDTIRERLNLPPAPEVDETEWVLPRGGVVTPELKPSGAPVATAAPAVGAPAQAAGDNGKPGNVNADPNGGKTP